MPVELPKIRITENSKGKLEGTFPSNFGVTSVHLVGEYSVGGVTHLAVLTVNNHAAFDVYSARKIEGNPQRLLYLGRVNQTQRGLDISNVLPEIKKQIIPKLGGLVGGHTNNIVLERTRIPLEGEEPEVENAPKPPREEPRGKPREGQATPRPGLARPRTQQDEESIAKVRDANRQAGRDIPGEILGATKKVVSVVGNVIRNPAAPIKGTPRLIAGRDFSWMKRKGKKSPANRSSSNTPQVPAKFSGEPTFERIAAYGVQRYGLSQSQSQEFAKRIMGREELLASPGLSSMLGFEMDRVAKEINPGKRRAFGRRPR